MSAKPSVLYEELKTRLQEIALLSGVNGETSFDKKDLFET